MGKQPLYKPLETKMDIEVIILNTFISGFTSCYFFVYIQQIFVIQTGDRTQTEWIMHLTAFIFKATYGLFVQSFALKIDGMHMLIDSMANITGAITSNLNKKRYKIARMNALKNFTISVLLMTIGVVNVFESFEVLFSFHSHS